MKTSDGACQLVETKIMNAIIESASINIERGFMIDSWIHLDYGGSGQGFGGFCLHTIPKSGYSDKDTIPAAGHWIMRVMQIAGVESWNELPGKTVRVKATHSRVHAIGHIVKDDWFCPEVDFHEMRGEE